MDRAFGPGVLGSVQEGRAPRPPTMSAPPSRSESLEPSLPGSRWGRNAARVYLGVVVAAAVLLASELVSGRTGFGSLAISVLTAPWSGLLAPLASRLAPHLTPVAMRATGLSLVALTALLNARILYGIAARMERDARAGRAAR